ncbi:MAG: RND family efflux transporter MFP subunit [Enterobacterales bacterium]|jgi:RND family efflux transporter MFP subunit
MKKSNDILSKSIFKSLVCGTLCLLLLNACDNQQEIVTESPLRPVRTITVTSPDLDRAHEFTAVVDASRKADLSFKVSGELVEFNVNQGENVIEGQVIAKLDKRDIKIQLSAAQSSFDKSRADYQRAKNLIRSNTISQADFDKILAQYNSSKANLDTASNNLEYTELKASFNGIIAKKYTDNFQEISAKAPIVALHDLSNIYLKIDVPESIMIRVQRNDTPTNLVARFDAIKDIVFPLVYKEVSTQADDVTKTYEVTLSMVNPEEHTLLPGMTARVTAKHLLPSSESASYFYLPVNTVLKDSKGNYIFMVIDQGDGVGKIKRQAVTIGELTQLGIEIFSGIKQGDNVLTAGMSKVIDGMDVRF